MENSNITDIRFDPASDETDTYFKNTRQEMLQFLPKNVRNVLEIGCGQGVFSSNIIGTNETWGIEPTDAALSASTKLFRVLRGTFDEAKIELPRKYFDVIICNDVVEHMIDHDSFFCEIKKFMTDDGVIVGSIPNVRYYTNFFDFVVGRDWEYQNSGIMDRTHLRFFTKRSLVRCFQKHDYQIKKFKGINGGLRWRNTLKRYPLFCIFLLLITVGGFKDILHLQFAFQISKK